MTRSQKTSLRAALLAVVVVVIAQAWGVSAAFGQSEPLAVNGLDLDAALIEQEWVDPIDEFDLEDEPLAAVPDFDFSQLSESSVFESGVENLPVEEEADVELETERHLRSVQAIATAELARTTVDRNISLAESAVDRATNGIELARRTITRTNQEMVSANGEIRGLLTADQTEIDEQARLNAEVDVLNGAIIEIAIQAFTGENQELETLLSDPENTDVIERRVVTNEVREFQRDDIAGLESQIRASEQVRAELADELAPIEAANLERAREIDALNDEIDALTEERASQRDRIEELVVRGEELDETITDVVEFAEATAAQYTVAYHQRLSSFVDGTDIPLVALNAYVRASRSLAIEDQACGIHWSQLAGIGRIESIHGYFGESTLDVNGQTTEDILGLPLDGRVLSGQTSGPIPDATGRTQESDGVVRLARITDTDNGRLDGDREFDRAVGPMQFIPTTWRLFESDGNDDGRADPQNIYDAALAAARYLCDAPGAMITTSGEQRGYFAYNHDLAYSANVTRAGRGYHERLDVSPESSAFAAFARLPTPAEIAAAEAEAQAQAEIDDAVAAALAACIANGEAANDVPEGAGTPPDADAPTEAVPLSPEAQAAADAVVCPPQPAAPNNAEPGGEGATTPAEQASGATDVDAAPAEPETEVAGVVVENPEIDGTNEIAVENG